MSDDPAFDAYAADYDAALGRGLSLSGEDKHYFARGRVVWLKQRLATLGLSLPSSVLDFGCGTGTAVRHFCEVLGAARVVGVDASRASLNVAAASNAALPAEFHDLHDFDPDSSCDLAFCNGVFHHVLPADRPAAFETVFRSLRPGGLFAFWENNPWNPGTRLVMRRIPFDRDAILISAREAVRLLEAAGFEVLDVSFLFVFPRALRACRPVEPYLSRLPLGGQYQVICRRAAETKR